ncbi:MAG: hypothetical protein IIV19_06820 [Bacteroidaceae bacterium]|jgi:hypothetical protein|nr:hypothetical protein [Bacteroidaceae bacterium]
MFDFFKRNKKNSDAALSLSFYDKDNKKRYEVSYKSCEFNDYARVKVLDEYCDRVNMRFKRWLSNARFDSLVGYAMRNGFFSLDSLYQGDVKDGHKYVLSLCVDGKSRVVVDSFGAAPRWLRDFEVMLMNECIVCEDAE